MLLWNVIGMGAIFIWNGVSSMLIFSVLKWFGILRVTKECEILGLDWATHNELAYPECKKMTKIFIRNGIFKRCSLQGSDPGSLLSREIRYLSNI